MPHLRRVLPFVLLVMLIPASASAQGFLRWLGKLSGPGPFWGVSGEVYLKCFGARQEPGIMSGFRLPCPDATLDDKHFTIYLNVTGAVAENNPLNYGDAGAQEQSTAVRLLKVGASLDWTAHRTFDVGAGAGVAYFAGPRFDNFLRGYVQPARFAFRPLMLAEAATDRDGWLIVSVNWQILLGTIEGADFGAPLDSFRTSNEHDVELGLSVDIIRLARRLKPTGSR